MLRPTRTELFCFFCKNTNIDLPYAIRISAPYPGKNILITGSVHGNEPVGPLFAYNFIEKVRKNEIQLHAGSITFVLANSEAFIKDVRYSDVDMNRIFTFPKQYTDTIEYIRAREMVSFFATQRFDISIDLHSVSVGEQRILICNKNNRDLRVLLRRYSIVPMVFFYDPDHIPGTLVQYFEDHEVSSMALECGNHSSQNAVTTAWEQLFLFFMHYGILPKDSGAEHPILPPDAITAYETIGTVAAGDDFRWIAPQYTGAPIRAGDLIATSRTHGEQRAERDCILVMPTKTVSPTDYEAGFLCVETTP